MMNEIRIRSEKDCLRIIESDLPFGEKIEILAKFLKNARSSTDRNALNCAMENLVHLQFKHRKVRNFGMIVTEDEYWAIRNVVWNIDKQIFWNAVGKRTLHFYDKVKNRWVTFDDESNQWEGYDARSLEKVTIEYDLNWTPWTRVFNDDNAPDFKWYEGANTNLSYNALDRHILKDRNPHFYRYWESESWGADEPEEHIRLNHREYLFEVTKRVMALKDLGVQRHDRVALLMPEIPEAYYLIEAFQRMGIVYTSLPTSLGDQQVSDRIDNLDVKFVFTVHYGLHKGKKVFYKKDLLDCALGNFAKREYAIGVVNRLSSGLSGSYSEDLMSTFEKRFEKKVTIDKQDLLFMLEEKRVEDVLIEALKRDLGSEPDRVSKVVIYGKKGHQQATLKSKRDLDWSSVFYLGDLWEDTILTTATKLLGRKINRETFLGYQELSPQEFLRIIYNFSPPEIIEANYPRLVIYTSGSTGIPKGVIHRSLGHAVFGIYTMLVTMGPRDWDLMDTRATHSWITGLDYIAGMPGLLGVESIVCEGAFDYASWLKRLDRLNINISKAGAPVLRGMKEFVNSDRGKELISTLDFSDLRVCVNCAEPADPVTQKVVNSVLGSGKYINTWWPTELTGPNTGVGSSSIPFAYPMKNDASTFPLPYVKQDALNDEVDSEDNVVRSEPQEADVLGRYVIDPHPGMLAGVYGDPKKYFESYFQRYWGKTGDQIWYDSGDGAITHVDGYFHIVGRVGYAFNWNGHICGAEDLEGTLRDHPAIRDVMIAPVKRKGDDLDRLQVFTVLNKGYELNEKLIGDFDSFVASKKQKTFKGLMRAGSDYYSVDSYPVTMSQKSLRRFGSMLGSLKDSQISEIVRELDNPQTRILVGKGDEATINNIFPTKKNQNPYAGSLVGLGNYPSLIHLTRVVAKTKGVK